MTPEEPSDSEIEELLTAIQNDGVSVVAMSGFCGDSNLNFSCDSCTKEDELLKRFEQYNLSRLYGTEFVGESLEKLRWRACNIYLNLRKDQQTILDIELHTAAQSDGNLWSVLRIGRITASIFKDVLRTNLFHPSITLLKKICYPESCVFSTPSVKYGKQHEQRAIDELYQLVNNLHVNLRSNKSGLHIDQQDPCLGASPDAIFLCDCHGKISVEVKCPFSAKNCNNIVEVLKKHTDPFIFIDDQGSVCFSTSHKYYWQVFMQIHICEASFGYFYVWSENEQIIFEVQRDETMWNDCKSYAVDFFKKIVGPELLAKYYTGTR